MTLKNPKYWRTVEKYKRSAAMASQKSLQSEREENIFNPPGAKEWIEETNAETQLAATTYAERQAIDAIHDYVINRDGESTCKRGKEAAGQIIRQWLELNDETELEDAERGLRAVLKDVSAGNERWDVKAMPIELVLKLAESGCLSVDKKAMELDQNTPLRMDAKAFHVPAGVSSRLHVEEVK